VSFGMNFGPVLMHAQDLLQYTVQIDKFTNELEAQVAPMVAEGGSWDGAAKRQYQTEKKNWDDAIRRMKNNLAGMGATLNNVHDNTKTTENKNAGLFNNNPL
jgi:WXG100 family type VII secretion target